ncbi:MAG: 30S ribosomal protein S7 [Candidatus Omnitrophica bacterium CG07_land_8_20_14_0_80_42_15]|uniref:Small ribosomal subunit protein uS7 n=1 Tax=Candidatus Aquitaenariimonas noxiae TaxID=1974741 RepID=A0A2J0KT61_9BACT|nr:MAG: 30S ribosomal protein S7 [Candidatus Omnitrophica bacterium CG07_land_8_20_14_0_80_42_15]
MRRRRADKRETIPDPKYNNIVVTKFINMVMIKGKKSTAERIVYRCFDLLTERTKQPDPLEVFRKAIDNARPLLEVKPRRVGGATYQVPVEVKPERGTSVALMWFRNFARAKKGKPMEVKLADEILDAYKGEGAAIKKRQDTHKMAEANKAFAHYRW